MSELRQDLVSGDWVLLAPGRAGRPKFLDVKRPPRISAPKDGCPFEDSSLRKDEVWPPKLAFPSEEDWDIIVVPNKFPAVMPEKSRSIVTHDGPYTARTAVGEHDLIITRDHNKNFAGLSPAAAVQVMTTYQALCKDSAENPVVLYSVPFWNWGPMSGASVWHPHYQFLSLPIIPAHSAHSLEGAARYFKKNHRCVRCDIIRFEKKSRVRIIAENDHAIAFAPYASKLPFEVRIMPKRHESYFYQSPLATVKNVAQLLQIVLRAMKKNLNDPDLNAFIHEAPLAGKSHAYHHWHVEIIPRVSTMAGFEFSTGIYINTALPEKAAETLRSGK
jgi:UDPglucose--hexose-1-phosphate uridylyltransferase